MSFQGDVAGIGLGELLQGLSRGGRDGVLSLYGEKISAALGLHRGQLYLLAGPDEEEETWRDRASCAYADDPRPEIETARRERIARAARMEGIYQMLEAPNLHFRFEPGPLPLPSGHSAGAQDSISLDGGDEFDPNHSPWGPGLTVEYMLLEHARISDEGRSGAAATLSAFDIPRSLDASRETRPEVRDFLESCSGTSTLQELSDRLGWPLTQTRTTVGEHIEAGNLRLAQPRELLAGAQRELELGRIGRAAVRLSGWVLMAEPGPPPVGDAELLVGEWECGRLAHILHALEPRVGRALLRKLDSVHLDKRAARDRWRSLYEAQRTDEISMLHEVALRLVASEELEPRTFHDLLRLARVFQERGYEARTRTLLRLAAGHLPANPQTRIELGKRMLETGLVAEGTRWLVNTAHSLIEAGDPERALDPISAVLREVPDHNEAGSLQIHARTLLANKKKRRVHMIVALSFVLMVSLGALVRYRSFRTIDRWESEIQNYLSSPAKGIGLLDEEFGEEPPERIAELRARLVTLQREEEKRAYSEWNAGYTQAEDACRFGDPLLGLRRALDLSAPPGAKGGSESLPERQDLLGILASRLGDRSEELNVPPNAPLEELNDEERFIDLLDEMLEQTEVEAAPEVTTFHFRGSELRDEVVARRGVRATERAALAARERDEQQDILLATARAHGAAGDLERSITAYNRLMASDETLAGLPELKAEVEQVQAHWNAFRSALELCESGEHEAAAKELEEVCPRPIEHLLPFRVTSIPPGVRVSSRDGRVRTTPFVAKSGVGEVVELRFSSPGYLSEELRLDRPMDLRVHMHRLPERTWKNTTIVEAVPVPAGDDHIVADRHGNLRRLDGDSKPKWKLSLKTLGGIARTPIFLPGRPGHLLVVAEDGQVWLVNATTGDITGPRDVGFPPVDGPVLTRSGVTVSYADGRIGVWTDRLEPTFFQNETMVSAQGNESEVGLSSISVLRRSVDSGATLRSPWNDWTAEVRENDYRVLSPEGLGFTAERHGNWVFVAWESPKAFMPYGRLWVSDALGLRSYLPAIDELVSFDAHDEAR